MTNHVHLLVTPQTSQSIGKTLQSIGRRYVQHFNHRYQRTGEKNWGQTRIKACSRASLGTSMFIGWQGESWRD